MSQSNPPLLLLVQELRACPARDTSLSEQSLRVAWDKFKAGGWDAGRQPPFSVLVALVLHDEVAATLLTTEELGQLIALGDLALTRYRERTQPPNPIGRLVAATIKENP